MPTSEQLMAAMRGAATRFEVPEPKGDPRAVEILGKMRGDTDYSHIHEANRQGQAEHDAAVRRHARELRAQGVHHPEDVARTELHMAAQSRKEQADRRAVYEAMTANNRAESEANSTEALRGRIKAATEERRKDSLRQVLEDIVTQALKKTASA